MTKPDDSSLDPDQLRAVEGRAQALLDRASAWERFPTPVDDILAAAKLTVAPHSAFDPAVIMAFVRTKAVQAAHVAVNVKSAIAKMFGIYDGGDNVIHIDDNVGESKQTFVKLHETGHHELPLHRKLFRIFQDCDKNLAPEVADQFEREANNFARFALFQGDEFRKMAADCACEIKTPMRLAKKFGASVYAASREFARTHHKACVVYVLEPIQFCEKSGARAAVRRIEPSPAFRAQFGCPGDTTITLDHRLGEILPIGRKMTRPREVTVVDLNGVTHECVAEAFDTTFNVIILLFPVKALTAVTIIVPSGFGHGAGTAPGGVT
jgi:Zn-dependent peptidase ImmA (M78 family)